MNTPGTKTSRLRRLWAERPALARWTTSAVAAVGLWSGAGAVQALPIDCQQINAENAANPALATVDGYTVGTGITAAGALSINNQTLALPPNGIICVASISCANSSRSLTFTRNAGNTPVYLLVENNVTLQSSSCGIDVSGGSTSTRYGIGMDRVGGTAGPGGGDGGSCDFTYSTPKRAGEGIGPGGGKGSAFGAGGGGASPIANGAAGFGASAAAGGLSYSAFDHRILFGGSGGGCGSNSGQSSYNGGGGGGGVIVLGAGGSISLDGSNSYVRARGGSGSTYGGGGGGGVVRLVADTIQGTSGLLAVDGSAAATCGTSGNPGGCGGYGMIKLEGTTVSGAFIANSSPQAAIHYGVQQPLVPGTGQRPTLVVSGVTATFNGTSQTVVPAQLAPAAHVHTSAGVFLEAPASPEQVIAVELTSNNVPSTATVRVKMNTLGPAAVTTTATTAGTGSGVLSWQANVTVPAGMELGTIEAWVDNVCTPGTAGCP